MTDTKLLQAILDGQASIREEIVGVKVSLQKDIKGVRGEVKENTKRLNTIGKQLAYLEDDAPTIEEFEKLKKRVGKLEKSIVSN